MEAKAIARHIRQSPRKIRIVLDEVRGCGAEEALNYLHFSKAKASVYLDNPVAIGEHPQFTEELDKLINVISSAEENIKTIHKQFGEHND